MMRIRPALLLVLVAAAAASAAKPPATPPAPSFGETVEVNVVNVEVFATDKQGNRVTDLKKGDFAVFEDGKPVDITNFAAADGGGSQAENRQLESTAGADAWSLVVFFDNYNLRPESRTRALRQLRQFLDQPTVSGGNVMLVTLDPGLHIRLPFLHDRAALAGALEEIGKLSAHGREEDRARRQAFLDVMTVQEISLNDPDPLPCPLSIATPAREYASVRRQEVRRSIAALSLLVSSLSGVHGRKAVLHVSDGLPLTPGEEVFQLLVEICGGSGTSGFGKTGIINGPNSPGLRNDEERGETEIARAGSHQDIDPYNVFDARAYGPRAYQAASQAPLDAQSYSVAKDLQTLAAHANAQRVSLYTLQASGLAAPDAADAGAGPAERLFQFPAIGQALRATNRESLQLLADGTGGRSILDANDFLPDLARMRDDFASYYSLGFTPPHHGDGREHKIEVRVRRQGLRLRYRQSYRDKPALEKVADRTLAALLYGIEDNPLDIQVELGDQSPGPSGTWTVPVRLRIPLFKLAVLNREETFEGSLRLFVATRTPDGGTSPLRQIDVPLRIPRKQVLLAMGQFYVYTLSLQLKPGAQQVAVAVRDEIAATTSYLSRNLEVGMGLDRAAVPHL